jgi:hypothetical protein
VTDAIAGHHRAATRATFAPVSSSDPATARGRAASRSASAGDHQGEQAADDRPNQESRAQGKNQRKDVCPQIGADTLRDGMHDGMCDRMRMAHTGGALSTGAVVLQRQGEAEKAPDQGAAANYEVTQSPSNHPALSMTPGHRSVIGRLFGLLN